MKFGNYIFQYYVTGKENWSGLCRYGKKQSPIDLNKQNSVIGYYPALRFRNFDKLLINSTVSNTGHSSK